MSDEIFNQTSEPFVHEIALPPGFSGRGSLLMRHAERDPILPGESVFEAGLTDRGRREARSLGGALRDYQLGVAVSSPVERCKDTAMCVCEGWIDRTVDVLEERILLDAYIRVPERARELYNRYKPQDLILEYLRQGKMDGFFSVEEGVGRMLRRVLDMCLPES